MNTRRGFLRAFTTTVFAVAMDILPTMGLSKEEDVRLALNDIHELAVVDIMPMIADHFFKSGPIMSYMKSK